MGLPNNGLDYYLNYLLELQEKEPNRYLLSIISWNVSRGNSYHIKKVQDSDFHGLTELNLSCPNVPGKPSDCL